MGCLLKALLLWFYFWAGVGAVARFTECSVARRFAVFTIFPLHVAGLLAVRFLIYLLSPADEGRQSAFFWVCAAIFLVLLILSLGMSWPS